MSALDEVGRQGVPGHEHPRPALGESDEPGRRRTLMAAPRVIVLLVIGAIGRPRAALEGGAGLLVCRSGGSATKSLRSLPAQKPSPLNRMPC
jgi:hypothetical protein